MKIAVYGAGGVGAYFGGRLARAGANVHLVARGTHLEALQRDGLRVDSVRGDFEVELPATDDPASIGVCDYVLFAVKSFDTIAAARELEPLLGEETAVISLQNGVDNEERLAEEIGADRVMGGVAYVFSTIAEPGVIEQTGGPASITFGELDGTRSERAERLLELCERADGMNAELSTTIRTALWEKAAFICAQAGMTAAVRLPLGEIRETPESWDAYRRIVEEACSVGRAAGVDLPDDAVSRWMAFAAELNDDSYSSLHYDMTREKPMELEALHGAVVRKGREHGVAVPTTETVYAILRPWAARNRRDG
ncbi:2-dehydropantoate 2-reductase [Natronococcus sp. A-GB7]|uniref:2-dehydropantoate 2-reductase n=1 Tax=Natronococcus sp. A-GB7 TaxID=3037649 RepID=UPI00241D8A92|nr:2-dehydropantoate 2-reductase [Natronococcus sp. A-GB7]MDG5818171.1 2-dehydropantoate 2-reductase [Natronococcus sp. A-GB7]